jgi:hypothetical protein
MFSVAFFSNVLFALYVVKLVDKKKMAASLYSTAQSFCTVIFVLGVVSNAFYAVAFLLGVFVGTYYFEETEALFLKKLFRKRKK